MNFVNTCYGLCSLIVLTSVTGLRSTITINGRSPEECSATEWYYCFLSPCYFESCLRYPSADCSVRTTRCGGCRAVWSIDGREVNCDAPPRCPLGMREMICPNTLCAKPFCPDYPEAICWPDTCGHCGEIYLLDGLKVDCFRSIRHRIRQLPAPKTNYGFPNPTSPQANTHVNKRVRPGRIPPSVEQPFQTTQVKDTSSVGSLADGIIGFQHPNGHVTLDIPAHSGRPISSVNVEPSGDVKISRDLSGVNNDPSLSIPANIPQMDTPRQSNPSESKPSGEITSSDKLPFVSSNPQVPNTLNVQSRTSSNLNTVEVPITSNLPSQPTSNVNSNFPLQATSNVDSSQIPITPNFPSQTASTVNSAQVPMMSNVPTANINNQNTEPQSAININSDPFVLADTNNGLPSQNNSDFIDTQQIFLDLGLGDGLLLDSPVFGMDPTANGTTQTASDVNNNPSLLNSFDSTNPFSTLDLSGIINEPIDNTQQPNLDPLNNQPVQTDQIGNNVPLSSPTFQASSSDNSMSASTVSKNPTQTSTDVVVDPFLSSSVDATNPFANTDLSPILSASSMGSSQINPTSGVEVNSMKTTISPFSNNNQPQPNNVKVDQNLGQTNPTKSMDPTSWVGEELVPVAPQNSPFDPANNPIVAPQSRQPDQGNPIDPTLNRPESQNSPTTANTSQSSDPLIPTQRSASGDSQIPIDMVAPRIPGAAEIIQSTVQPTGIVKPCLPGTTEVTCVENPCANQTCHLPGAVCHQSGCGSCHAEWQVDGRKVDCSPPCPRDTIEAVCRDPCTFLGCPAYPNAICRMSKCSACTANYYVNNKKVNCDLVTETCPPGEEPRGCTCPIKICPYNLQVRCRIVGCGSNCSFEFYKMTPEGVGEPVECGWFSRKRG